MTANSHPGEAARKRAPAHPRGRGHIGRRQHRHHTTNDPVVAQKLVHSRACRDGRVQAFQQAGQAASPSRLWRRGRALRPPRPLQLLSAAEADSHVCRFAARGPLSWGTGASARPSADDMSSGFDEARRLALVAKEAMRLELGLDGPARAPKRALPASRSPAAKRELLLPTRRSSRRASLRATAALVRSGSARASAARALPHGRLP